MISKFVFEDFFTVKLLSFSGGRCFETMQIVFFLKLLLIDFSVYQWILSTTITTLVFA